MFQTEYEFTLPMGYLDDDGTLHRDGVMRLATAADEILPLKDAARAAQPGLPDRDPALARRHAARAASTRSPRRRSRACSPPTSRTCRTSTTDQQRSATGAPVRVPRLRARVRGGARPPWGGRGLPPRSARTRRWPSSPTTSTGRTTTSWRSSTPTGAAGYRGDLGDQRADERGDVRLLAFARSLLARWDRRVVSPRPLGLVFRQAPRARAVHRRHGNVTHTHLRRDLHVDLHPRIALTVVRPPGEAGTGTVRERVSTGSTVERAGMHHELVLRNTSLLAAERVVRAGGVESAAGRACWCAPAPRPDAWRRPPSGRARLRRSWSSMPHAQPAAGHGAATRRAALATGRPPASRPPLTSTSARLTERVVSAIDRRLVATPSAWGAARWRSRRPASRTPSPAIA